MNALIQVKGIHIGEKNLNQQIMVFLTKKD